MAEEVIQTQANLTGDPKPMKKKTKWWHIVIDVVLVVAFVAVIAVSTNIIYLSAAYTEPFFVNGMSMYPTLNHDGQHKNSDGSYRALTWADGDNSVGDIVDYGYAKTGDKDSWRDSIKRYDILIVYYKSDFQNPYADEPVLKDSAKPKIKRLIGLPGETVTFAPTDVNDETGNTAWGKTTINGEPLKPLYGPEDYPDVNGRHYDKVNVASYANVTLGENEYYVMGDNRGGPYSDDSRNHGPIKASWIYGKAYLVTAMRELELTDNNSYDVKFRLDYIKMPWDYLRLG